MRNRVRASQVAVALVLAVLLGAIGWQAIGVAIAGSLPPGVQVPAALAHVPPDVELDRAVLEFTLNKGIVRPETLQAVRRAAARAPLDARPYLFEGVQHILHRDRPGALRLFEAGRRLDPRQRWIHVFLLDGYLRTRRFAEAGTEFAVLSRLVTQASSPIAAYMATMIADPAARPAIRQALRTDPALEQQVLRNLAKTSPVPDLLFALASPAALASAGQDDGWGPVLIQSLIDRGQYGQARAVWNRVFRLPDAVTAAPVYDGDFQGRPGAPPFNWATADSTIGAVDIRQGKMNIDYYGRASGDLASQLLTLAPGRYRFSFAISGSQSNAGATIGWTLTCIGPGSRPPLLATAPLPLTSARRRLVATVIVPAGCPAQWLKLVGNAAEFPAPVEATVEQLAIQPLGAAS